VRHLTFAALRLALVALWLSFPADLAGQAVPGAVPVVSRFDPVLGTYRPEVLGPLSPDAVLTIQRALAAAGYPPGFETGELDAPTRAALRDFQTANGLRISGHPDYDTLVAIGVPVRWATPGEIAREDRRFSRPYRPYDFVIIGPSGSRGAVPPTAGSGVEPGSSGADSSR
jgi:peptidoglycan hydrolase-like protein with peptidoglycan-binding domain